MPLRLHDIEDVERFVAAISSRRRGELSFHDRQDLEQFLAIECWQLSLRFKPGNGRFSVYAGTILKRRVTDWDRKRFRTKWKFANRVYERPRPELISLDAYNSERDRLDPGFSSRAGDSAESGDPLFDGLLGARDRQAARDYHELGLRPPRRAP